MSASPWEQEYETIGDAIREHVARGGDAVVIQLEGVNEQTGEFENWREVPPSTIL